MSGAWSVQAKEVAPVLLDILEIWRKSSMPLSREDLARRCGCSDRVLRAAVAELREKGYLIIADPDGGYRFARNGDEVMQFTASLKSRIAKLGEVVVLMEAEARRQFGYEPVKQIGLFEPVEYR